jgi:hypothetical protein
MTSIISAHTQQNLELPWDVATGTTEDAWTIKEAHGGWYYIIYKTNNQELTATEQDTITLEAHSDAPNHHWKVIRIGDAVMIESKKTKNFFLQVDENGVTGLAQRTNAIHQKWLIEGENTLFEEEETLIPYEVSRATKIANRLGVVVAVISVITLVTVVLQIVAYVLALQIDMVVSEDHIYTRADYVISLSISLTPVPFSIRFTMA